jgi:hypothetical protein
MKMTKGQWEELKRIYGDNAYLMVGGGVTYEDCYGEISFSGCVDMQEDTTFDEFINSVDSAWVKQSAALPFDLVAAKKGDDVIFNNEPKVMNGADFSNAETWLSSCGTKIIAGFLLHGEPFDCPISLLTMKNPRRIGVDYDD